MVNSTDTMEIVNAEEALLAPSEPSRVTGWLIVCGLGLLFVPLFLMGQALQDDNQMLSAELDTIQLTLTSALPADPQEEQLRQELSEVRELTLELENVNLAEQHINWPDVMGVLANYDQSQLALTGLAQTGRRVILTGRAQTETAIMNYADSLEQSGHFTLVSVRSITLEALPTPAQRITPTPNTVPSAPRAAEFIILLELKAGDL